MDDVSLSPMHSAGICRTHWAISKKSTGGNHEKKMEGHNQRITSAKTSRVKIEDFQ